MDVKREGEAVGDVLLAFGWAEDDGATCKKKLATGKTATEWETLLSGLSHCYLGFSDLCSPT